MASQPGTFADGALSFRLALEPSERWDLNLEVMPALDDAGLATIEDLEDELETLGDAVAAWTLRVPKVRGGWESLRRAFDRSIADLAALRMRTGELRRPLFAAGMPWFMTVFGRDTEITSLQTLLLGPEVATGALEALAELQADSEDAGIDAEPGKIVHEVREGRAAEKWFARYYGSIDATPLFLVLLAETWRWTDDDALVNRLREPALKALEWIDRYGDCDGDGFVEYRRRGDGGLANQSWKDSGDSQRFHDGRLAEPPIAPVEVQGYVYDAKRGLAEIAREVWRDRALAERLEREAEELRERFEKAFWVEEHGGFYALALDGEKQPVDARCSNMGHLLWSGIAGPERVAIVVDQLLSEGLWSGWGIRTMASDDAAYNPLSYHNGTVWPHDTALAAWGLARHGYAEPARRVARALDRGRGPLRLVAARGLRRLRAGGDSVPDRLSDRRAAAGVGRGHADPARAGPARDRARPRAAAARHDGDGRAAELARRASGRGRARVRPDVVDCSRARTGNDLRRGVMRIGMISPVLVPGPAGGVRGNRARRRAARGRARRRRPRRDALRLRRLADPRPPRVRVPDRAERVDRAHVLGDAAHGPRDPPRGRLRRRPRPHGHARARVRRPRQRAVLPHRARAADRPAGADVRGRVLAGHEREAHLDLDEPAEAEAGPPVDRELPERARPLRVPVPASGRRVPPLPRAHEPGQGSAPRARRRARDRPAAEDRREVPRAARDPLLRRVHPAAPRRRRSSTSARSGTPTRSSS